MAQTVRNMVVLQCGLCAFTPDGHGGWLATPFAFAVFPQSDRRDRLYCFQPSSLRFLVDNHFDLTACVAGGIGSISPAEEKREAAVLADRQASARDGSDDVVLTRDSDRVFVAALKAVLSAWMETGTTPVPDPAGLLEREDAFERTEEQRDWLVLAPMNNGFLRRVVHEVRAAHFPRTLPYLFGVFFSHYCEQTVRKTSAQLASFKMDKNRIGVRRAADVTALLAQQAADAQRELQRKVGFRRVLDLLRDKVVVGHNMALDVCFLLAQFYDELPASVSQFKEAMRVRFPFIVDTKYVAEQVPGGWKEGTSLDTLLPLVGATVSVAPDCATQQSFHDAAFDALCTGRVFVGLFNGATEQTAATPRIFSENDIRAASCANRINLHQSDYECLRVDGPDVHPSRDHVLLMRSFPREWKNSHISAFLATTAKYSIVWRDDSMLYLVFETAADAEAVRASTIGKSDALLTNMGRMDDGASPALKRAKSEADTN